MTDQTFAAYHRVSESEPKSFQVARALRANTSLLPLVSCHVLIAVTISSWVEIPFKPGRMIEAGSVLTLLFIPVFLLLLTIWRCLYMATRVRPQRPLKWLYSDIKDIIGNIERLAGGLITLLIFVAFISSFTFIKAAIPVLNPFSWDQTFAALDLALHGGRHPYELIWPLLGTPAATTIVNFLYRAWFFVLYFIVFVEAFSISRPDLRSQFFLAFFLTWAFGGNVLAVLLSSAGPVYFERLGFGPDFAPLMTTLQGFNDVFPVWALGVQESLWAAYTGQSDQLIGISAMPSMHVASATLFALYGFERARWLGWLLTGFAVLIGLGSVHLGWHYAVDGYAGGILAALMWWVTGTSLRKSANTGRLIGVERLRIAQRLTSGCVRRHAPDR